LGKAWPALGVHVPECDPHLQELVLAELDDFRPTAIQDADGTSPLRAFFTTAEARDAAARALATAFGSHLFVETIDVEDDDWAARSQAQLRAVTIGRLVVAPPWDAKRGTRPLLVIIQPSMGFGTGHHATTRLTLKALQDLPLDNRTVLDIGCGSGVLAIAAVKLGARAAVGIDVDPDALENAKENATLNELGDRVEFKLGDFREMSLRADIVTANLTGGLLERSAAQLAATVEPGGYLVVSGFMDVEKAQVSHALEPLLVLERLDQEDEWMCAVWRSHHSQRSRQT